MKTAKTAISLPESLLEKTDKLAQNTGNTRSGVVALALQEYLLRQEQEEVLKKLNEVYSDEDEMNEDREFLDSARDYFSENIIEKESW
jgi:metal-responsive CopG/Arc/MetJ family transcriptional regulator